MVSKVPNGEYGLYIAIVVSDFRDGFEAAKVLNPIGGEVIVVPFPFFPTVSRTEMVPEARA